MRTSFTIASVLVSAGLVLAQNSTSTPSTIDLPEGISQGCHSFLQTLNSNSAVSSCLNGLVAATSDFDSANTGAGANATAITATLDNMCSTRFNTLCDPSVIRGVLADFYGSCGTDLVPADGSTGNKDVIDMYDTLYLVVPLRGAICSRDPASGKYCLDSMDNTSSSQKRNIYERADNTTSQSPLGASPDMTSYRQSGLPYLFLTPDSNMATLCSDCAARIIGSYVAFETVTPYALGVPNSQVLGGQVALWDKIQSCSNGIANQILNNSTGNSGTFSGAPAGVRVGMTGVVVALMSAVVATAALF